MSKLRNPNEDTPLLLAGGGGGHIDGGLLSADRAGQVGWNHRGVVQPEISDNVKTILTILMSKIIQNITCRRACSIPGPDSVVLTGGSGLVSSKVSRYTRQGWVEDLPDMSLGRMNHGCAAFIQDNEQVDIYVS